MTLRFFHNDPVIHTGPHPTASRQNPDRMDTTPPPPRTTATPTPPTDRPRRGRRVLYLAGGALAVILAVAFVDELVLEMLGKRAEAASGEALRNE